VVWKYAASLDGRSAAADGTSRWITSSQARVRTHRGRALCGAVMVGTGTALADDPRLTVRGVPVPRQPLRVVVGDRPLPPGCHLLDDSAPTVRIAGHDPAEALAELHRRGVHRVWLEGGPRLAGAFWKAGLIDEVIAQIAPILLGSGPTSLADAGVATLAGAHRLIIDEVSMVGPDVEIRAHPRPPSATPLEQQQDTTDIRRATAVGAGTGE
jgi:diaminohydroxyphosphoribosylaminopyrimidine deaminase/5-amino-6-(5-phosphoribosylamino)uracil reductase